MVDATRFVDGATLDVRLLAGTLVGGVLIAWWANFIEFLQNLGEWAATLATAPVEAFTELLEALLAIPENTFGTAWSAAGEFVAMLQPLGPFAYVVAMVITLVTAWVGAWVVDKMGLV